MGDFRDTQINLADLKPNKRLRNLRERSKCILISGSESVYRYCLMSDELFRIANYHYGNNNPEEAFVMFLKYKYLMEKIKRHPRHRCIPLQARAAAQYKLFEVTEKINLLGEELYKKFKRIYRLTSEGIKAHDGAAYQERRPTESTVRTFTSENSVRHIPSYIDRKMHVELLTPKRQKDFDALHGRRRQARCFRTLNIPARLMTIFAYESAPNTRMNLETVAFLAGEQVGEQDLNITNLIFPKQHDYSDYFQVINSDQIHHFLYDNNLLLMGWIHSHPKEEIYLTSADVHFQCVFQQFLPEAVAMVYGVAYGKTEIFNLTPDHGIKFISGCPLLGFHTHPTNPPITMVSQHALIDPNAPICVKDFRNDKEVFCFPHLGGESAAGEYSEDALEIDEWELNEELKEMGIKEDPPSKRSIID